MELSEFIIIILLSSSLLIWFMNFYRACPPVIQPKPQIIYRYRPELDLQFDENNMPSKIYDYVFTGPNVYQGGYHMDQGRVVMSSQPKKSK